MSSVPSYDTLEPRMQAHLDALGFHSVGSYRIWCHKQGLDKGLTKGDGQLAAEAQLLRHLRTESPPAPRVDHRPGTCRTIVTVADGKASVWTPLVRLFAATRDRDEREALKRILIHIERFASLGFESGARLAKHHADWLRPPEAWFPKADKAEVQVGELANHLLARFPAPLFLGRAWLEDGPAARYHQEWFLHVARGGSIRDLDTDIHLTKRMAHRLRQVPANLTISQGLRWAQCAGMGAPERLTRAIVRSRLRDFAEDEPFWASAVRFFINQPLLDPSQVGPAIDYLHNQRFVPREVPGPDGRIAREPPPQPDLAMKGRSIDKLLRQVEEWHRQVAKQASVPWVEWPSCGIDGFAFAEPDEERGADLEWRIAEVRNTHNLLREGSAMGHCIYSYKERCARGQAVVFSLRVCAGEEREQPVMTIAVDPGDRVVTEYRGKYNLRPGERKALAKGRELKSDYLRLLDRSEGIMRRWMAQEGLTLG